MDGPQRDQQRRRKRQCPHSLAIESRPAALRYTLPRPYLHPRRRLRETRTLQEVALFAFSQAGARITYQKTAKKSTPDWGARLETFVFLELKRRGHEVFTVMEPDYEVDFMVREGRRCARLIQVCYRLEDPATKEREFGALVKAARLKNCRELLVLTHDEQDEVRKDGVTIRVVPAWRWALNATL